MSSRLANIFLECDDCMEVQSLGAIEADQSCINFDRPTSQVNAILILPEGVTVEDWTSDDDWGYAISNPSTDTNFGKYIAGIGGVPVPEKDIENLGKSFERVGIRTYTLNFRVINISDAMYDMLSKLQCADLRFNFWYTTTSGYIFGGPNGICPIFVDVDRPLGSGREDFMFGDITLKWCADGDPSRAELSLTIPPPYQPPPNVIGDGTNVIGEPTTDEAIGDDQ